MTEYVDVVDPVPGVEVVEVIRYVDVVGDPVEVDVVERDGPATEIVVPPAIDPDVDEFLGETGIDDEDIAAVLDVFAGRLKDGGIWSRFHALYPLVGADQTPMGRNLVDPRDADDAHRIEWFSDGIWSATGFQSNGSGWGDCNYVPSIHGTDPESTHLSFYSRTQTPAGNLCEFGAYGDALADRHHLLLRYTGDTCYFGQSERGTTQAVQSLDSRGLFVTTRVGPTSTRIYRNGALLEDDPTPVGPLGLNPFPVYIGRISGFAARTDRECGFASIGDKLEPDEVALFDAAVLEFVTGLDRVAA